MRRFLYLIIFVVLLDLTFQQCANPGRPTGGPKDTIPPTLINAIPTLGTTNFTGAEIELEFSEYINADKLKQQLIITPKTDLRYKHIVKRNKLIIKLESDLLDSTTYSFNFGDGVTDITEKNPVINLSLAFSTGPFIDSLSIEGEVEELLTKEAGKGYVVSLYPYTDSLDYFTDSPIYFTTANDSGKYSLNYIKSGKYKILAFDDDNGNFLLDPETESHGFLESIIDLDSSLVLPTLRCVLQNVKPIKLINARPAGPYVEAKYNKQIDNYQLTNEILKSNRVGEKKEVVRIFKPELLDYNDSIETIIIASDSLGNQANDTIKFVFLESNRKPSGFSFTIEPNNVPLVNDPNFTIDFNKPITKFDSTKIQIVIDSTKTFVHQKTIQWNYNFTKADITIKANADILLSELEKILPKDTISNDSTSQPISLQKNVKRLEIKLIEGAFVSAEKDTSKVKSIPLQVPKEQQTGKLKIKLDTELTHFTLQLITKRDKVLYQIANQKNIIFSSIKPDTYKIRILIDSNKDGNWSYGNLIQNQEPEEVYLHPEETSVRENWEIELSITL
ncbi:Ig-like domain-containing protein [Ekhidna sp.]|uniref:Ig-like domain-containing protein n=1 Tax=Ekhidna sp. TaxID=2608089 RepID=UPI0032F0390C